MSVVNCQYLQLTTDNGPLPPMDTKRTQRVADLLLHEVARILQREVKDPRGGKKRRRTPPSAAVRGQ